MHMSRTWSTGKTWLRRVRGVQATHWSFASLDIFEHLRLWLRMRTFFAACQSGPRSDLCRWSQAIPGLQRDSSRRMDSSMYLYQVQMVLWKLDLLWAQPISSLIWWGQWAMRLHAILHKQNATCSWHMLSRSWHWDYVQLSKFGFRC